MNWSSSGGAHPERRIELAVTGDCCGHWDGPRLQQSLRNLVSNAIKYGTPDTPDTPVRVAFRGAEADIYLEVTNTGPPVARGDVAESFPDLPTSLRRVRVRNCPIRPAIEPCRRITLR
jgi:signal transduction histidine kinase